MQGEIKADLAAMPFENMALLFGGIAVLLVLFAIIVIVVVRKLGIDSIGPIRMERRCQSTEHYMNDATRDADDLCRKQMRQATGNMKIYISNIFAELKICTIARIAISSIIRFPMYESIANNHFTTELTANYESYRERIIEMMREEYISLSTVSKDIQCNREALPAWEQVSKQIIACIDMWLKRISREVSLNCEKKISIYKTYLPSFESAKDDYRAGFTKDCIEKNERYMAILKTRMGRD